MDGMSVGPYLNTIILDFNQDVQTSLNKLAEGNIDFIWQDLPLDFIPQIALSEFYGNTGVYQKALYFDNRALKTARKNGAAKHEAIALKVKAGILHDSRPKMARACLERAFELSENMDAKLLSRRIREATKTFGKR